MTAPGVAGDGELVDAIADATRAAVASLFREHPGSYYYLSLITTGEGHAPFLSAWSWEDLDAAAGDAEAARAYVKWSYADSPRCFYGEEHFERVRELFAQRPALDWRTSDEDWKVEHDARLRAMEAALARLDAEGVFGEGAERLRIVVNAEVMPPDSTNTERARRLNPPAALLDWLDEAAE